MSRTLPVRPVREAGLRQQIQARSAGPYNRMQRAEGPFFRSGALVKLSWSSDGTHSVLAANQEFRHICSTIWGSSHSAYPDATKLSPDPLRFCFILLLRRKAYETQGNSCSGNRVWLRCPFVHYITVSNHPQRTM